MAYETGEQGCVVGGGGHESVAEGGKKDGGQLCQSTK